jgi:hypothetical protein
LLRYSMLRELSETLFGLRISSRERDVEFVLVAGLEGVS